MEDDIEVTLRDSFSRHGEELVRSRYAHEVRKWLAWPQTGVSVENFRDKEVVVAKVNGVVVGRAILDAVYYPFAELENLDIAPAFRGRGIGGRLVADAIKRAADMGFLALQLQTELDNVTAHRVYAQHGFLPATQGEMLKLVRFLNYPVLSHFLWEHPLALFGSCPVERSGVPVWELSWTNPIGGENLAIQFYGGSCQADSGGFGPAISSFRVESTGASLRASAGAPRTIRKGQTLDLEIEIANTGSTDLEAACRLLLNPGFRPAPETQGSAALHVNAGSSEKVVLPVQVLESFNDEVLGICAFRSVSMVAEIYVGDYVFWLSCQHKIERAG